MPMFDLDACELLDADHMAVKHLFVSYARMATAMPLESAADRREVAMKICEELTVHAQIEEEIFYPALREAVPQAADLLDEAQEEHQQARDLVTRIQACRNAGPEMDDLVAELARAVERHVKEERDELFPKARAGLGGQLGAIGDQLRERQRALLAASA